MKRGKSEAASFTASSASSTVCLRPSVLRAASLSDCTPIDRQFNSRGAIAAKPPRLDAGRIGFEGDLRRGIEPPLRRDRVDDPLDGLRTHQRGRAAAKEHRGDGSTGR